MKKTETGAFLDSVLTHKINKMNDITSKNILQLYCNRECNKCLYKDICY